MVKKDAQSAAPTSSADPQHLHCWHWAPELTGEPPIAEAKCCWDGETVQVGEDNPVLRGEHGPQLDADHM